MIISSNKSECAPETLGQKQQDKILKITDDFNSPAFRDRIILSFAMGAALRQHEIVALNIGDVYTNKGKPKNEITLKVFKRSDKKVKSQVIPVSKGMKEKLKLFYLWKKRNKQSVSKNAAMFISKKKNRLSTRQIRHSFKQWQIKAKFKKFYSFHKLRHTSITNYYKKCIDLVKAKIFARHKDIRMTDRYTHPTFKEVCEVANGILC